MINEEAKKIIYNQWQSFLEHNIDYAGISEAYKMAIKALEQTRWIPVTERLPEERIAVLVWCPERRNIYCACYEEKQWWIFGAYFKKIELDVIAWMPLPKAYEEE